MTYGGGAPPGVGGRQVCGRVRRQGGSIALQTSARSTRSGYLPAGVGDTGGGCRDRTLYADSAPPPPWTPLWSVMHIFKSPPISSSAGRR